MFAKATRAVGEEVNFSTEFDSVTSCGDLLHNPSIKSNDVPSRKLSMSTKKQRGEKTQLDRRGGLKITVDGDQSHVPAQKTKYLKQAKAAGFDPMCVLSRLDPSNVKHRDNRTR